MENMRRRRTLKLTQQYPEEKTTMRSLTIILLLTLALSGCAEQQGDLLDEVIASEHRDAKNVARDVYRHPGETLSFFGIEPDMHALEILPGAGWYTEILAPYLRDDGLLAVASFGPEHSVEFLRNMHNGLIEKFDGQPDIYGKVVVGVFNGEGYLGGFEDESFDVVLTFRNTHNWIRLGGVEDIYRSFYRVLKPGGTLGVVQHRAEAGSDAGESAENGYVPESYMIELLEGIGFELVDKSEINANPNDTKDYEKGVWTLPPTYRMGDTDRAKYAAIGESDRMTMKFVKL